MKQVATIPERPPIAKFLSLKANVGAGGALVDILSFVF
jgi:hypothetical protein